MSKGSIVIIGANDFQNPLILKAKEMGYTTHVFAWKKDAIGEKTADVFYPISIVEKESILSVCREIQPKAVVSIGSDLAAITVNYLANALGLPGNPPETSIIATNKYEMRKAFQMAGIPTPQYFRVGVEDDLSAVRRMRFPVIVKPTDRSGSRSVMKLSSEEGLEEAIKTAAESSFEKRAIIEEYIEGNEYSCECITEHGQHHLLAITKKYTTGAPHFIEIGHVQPSDIDENTCEMVRTQVFKALDALHVTCGATHSEFKILPDTNEIRFIEIGARMGGDCIGSDLVQISTGRDFVRMTIEAALGEKISLDAVTPVQNAAIRFVFNHHDLEHYEWLRETYPQIIWRASEIHVREEENVTDSSNRFGFYILASNADVRSLADLR